MSKSERANHQARPPSHAAVLQVLLVSQSPEVWGAERTILDLAPLLRDRGVMLTLGGPAPGRFRAAWTAAGFPSVDLELPHHRGVRHPDVPGRRPPPAALFREAATVVRSAVDIARWARRFDLVQSESLWGHLEVGLAGRLAGRPVVLQVHDLVAPGLGRHLLRGAVGLATATVAVSGAVATTTGSASAKVTVLHHGVDLERFRPGTAYDVRTALGGVAGVPLVGILGRLDPEKGIDVVVRAMERLDGPTGPPTLAVVGDGLRANSEDIDRLKADARRRLGQRVRFVGRRTDIPEVIRSLDVLVNASAAEPFGLTVLEAMASGTAVVATAAGGIPELVADGVTGTLVPPGDERALAEALARVCGDDGLRRRLATNARATVEALHRPEVRADRLVDLYRAAVAR